MSSPKPEENVLLLAENTDDDGADPGLSLNDSSDEAFVITQFPLWHPKGPIYRYAVLFVACIFSVGSYFAYDSVGIVQTDIQNWFGIEESRFNLLYSVYSFPNIILPFLGGYILDRVGLPVGTLVACFFIGAGATVVALASYTKDFSYMLAGRFFFGMGAETSYVAQNTICCLWFKDKRLALAMGLTVSAGRLGSWFTFSANSMAVEYYGDFRAALWLGAVLSILSFIGGIVYFILHKTAERLNKAPMFESAGEPVDLRKIAKFPPVFWLAVVVCTVFYITIFPFQSTGTNFIQSRFGYSYTDATRLVSLLPLSALFLSPLFGLLVDKIAKRAVIVSIGLFFLTIAFGAMYYTALPQPIVSVVLLGIVFSVVPAAIWPCIPLLIPEEFMGTAFGLLSGIMNAGLTAAYAVTEPDIELIMFTCMGLCGFALSLLWNYLDTRDGGTVNSLHPLKKEPHFRTLNNSLNF